MASTQPKILLIAGEASGDMHGARLLRAISALRPDVIATGIGGDRLEEAGLAILFPAREMNVVGFLEVARRYRFLRSVFDAVVEWARRNRPAFAILIDYPGFNLRLARELHMLGIPVVYYISPQLWAWKEGRVEQMRKYVAELIVVFPFEVDWFARHGIEAHFFGHPLVDEIAERRVAWLATATTDETPTLAYLPGSRPEELKRHMPVLTGVIERIGTGYRHLVPRASTVSCEMLETGRDRRFEIVESSYDALRPATAALVKSGTSTVETALVGVPFAVVYKTSPITYQIARRAIRVPFLAMVNILAGREIVREFIQDAVEPVKLTEELLRLATDTSYREEVGSGIAEVREALGGPGAPARTAEFIVRKFL